MRYLVYGVVIDSCIALPELREVGEADRWTLPPATLTIEVTSRRDFPVGARIALEQSSAERDAFSCFRVAGGFRDSYAAARAEFFISADGSRVLALEPLCEAKFLRHLLLDAVVPRALSQLGLFPLHATAVKSEKGVVAFVGRSGFGKSTLAAFCAEHGWPLVTDDCLVLASSRGAIVAQSGYAGVRVTDEGLQWFRSISATEVKNQAFGTKYRAISERTAMVTDGELARLYLLGDASYSGSSVQMHLLSERESFLRLFEAAFRIDPSDERRVLRHFQFFSDVAQRIETKRLLVPRDFAKLQYAFAALRDDLRS